MTFDIFSIAVVILVLSAPTFLLLSFVSQKILKRSAEIVKESLLETQVEFFLEQNPNSARLGILRPQWKDKYNIVSVSDSEFIRFVEKESFDGDLCYAVFRDEIKVCRWQNNLTDAISDFGLISKTYLEYQESASNEEESQKFSDWQNELILVAVPGYLMTRLDSK